MYAGDDGLGLGRTLDVKSRDRVRRDWSSARSGSRETHAACGAGRCLRECPRAQRRSLRDQGPRLRAPMTDQSHARRCRRAGCPARWTRSQSCASACASFAAPYRSGRRVDLTSRRAERSDARDERLSRLGEMRRSTRANRSANDALLSERERVRCQRLLRSALGSAGMTRAGTDAHVSRQGQIVGTGEGQPGTSMRRAEKVAARHARVIASRYQMGERRAIRVDNSAAGHDRSM